MRVADLPLAWRTEFILHRFDGQVREEADAIVVTTPSAPTFYWGNFVLMPAPPRDADITSWCARFEREVAAVEARARGAHERCATEVLAALEHAVGEIACAA
jgi:hypothetical protein